MANNVFETAKDFYSAVFPDVETANRWVVIVLGGCAAIAFISCCGGVALFLGPAKNSAIETSSATTGKKSVVVGDIPLVVEGRDARLQVLEGELEVLPPIRTGLSREIAKTFISHGNLEQWAMLSPVQKVAISRFMCQQLYPENGDSHFIAARSATLHKMLDDQAAAKGSALKELVREHVALFYSIEKSIDEPTKK